MRGTAALLACLVAYVLGSWLIRVALTAATIPLAGVGSLTRSRWALNALRLLVGFACGCGAFAAGLWLAGRLGGVGVPLLGAVVAVLTAAFHLYGAWPMRRTRQLADDMVSLVGEEAGVAAVLLAVLR